MGISRQRTPPAPVLAEPPKGTRHAKNYQNFFRFQEGQKKFQLGCRGSAVGPLVLRPCAGEPLIGWRYGGSMGDRFLRAAPVLFNDLVGLRSDFGLVGSVLREKYRSLGHWTSFRTEAPQTASRRSPRCRLINSNSTPSMAERFVMIFVYNAGSTARSKALDFGLKGGCTPSTARGPGQRRGLFAVACYERWSQGNRILAMQRDCRTSILCSSAGTARVPAPISFLSIA